MGKDRLTCYCKVMGPNFESLTVRALGLAALKKRPNAGQSALGSYSSDLGLLYHNIFPCPSAPPGVCFEAPCSERSDRPQIAPHFSCTGIPGEPKRESTRVLSPQPRERIDGPTEGGERTLVLSRFGSPGIPKQLKCGAVLWPIGSLRARRFKTDSRRGRRTWEDTMVEQAEI